MQQPSPLQPFPDFERPSEAVVYCALEGLCRGGGGRITLPLPKLAEHVRLSLCTTKRAVTSLTKRGLIGYRRGQNQHEPSVFEMPPGAVEAVPTEAVERPIIARPSNSDVLANPEELLFGDDIDQVVDQEYAKHRELDEAEERLACRIADGLGDLKNLKLYRSYCRRFPADMILKAFVRAKEPTSHQIKVSRGALFNYLVQHYAKGKTE